MKKFPFCILFIAIFLQFLVVPIVLAIVVEEIVAKVNDEIILKSEFEEYWESYYQLLLENQKLRKSSINTEAERKRLLDSLVDEELLFQLAAERDIIITEKELDDEIKEIKKRKNFKTDKELIEQLKKLYKIANIEQLKRQLKKAKLQQLLIRYLVSKNEIKEPTDKEIEATYQKNKSKFKVDDQIRISHILLKLPSNSSLEEVQKVEANMEKIKKKFTKDKVPFADLVKEYSEDELTKDKGGDLGFFTKEQLLQFFKENQVAKLFKLQKGQVSDILFSKLDEKTDGMHLIMVTDIKKSQIISFEEAKESIKQNLYFQRGEKLLEEMINHKRKNSEIKLYLRTEE